jgi:acetylglutamate kinase
MQGERGSEPVAPSPRRPIAASRLGEAVAGKTLVFKLGGSVGREDTLPEDTRTLQKAGARVVLVHGGGPLISSWLERIGKETRFVGGLRYTDEETLQVVRMVLGGLVNGEVVARLADASVKAIGLSGSDDRMLLARRRAEPVGLVGEITSVNVEPIRLLLDDGYAVAIAPVAVDGAGGFLNVNADTAAAEIATALDADSLIFLTDVAGVSNGSGNGPMAVLAAGEARRLIESGVIAGGMIPKVEGCLAARSEKRRAQIIDGRQPNAVIDALLHPNDVGTTITE